MIVINPPWTLATQMQETLPWLAQKLGIDGSEQYRIETLISE
jgi:23S rRNA A2030 N6-methylase RlmJ